MLPFEDIPCLSVVELGDITCPANQTEVAACVFSVTTRAVTLTLAGIDNPCVISLTGVQPLFYFHMTRQTLQLGAAGAECVTTPALQSSLKTLMSLR